MLPPAIKNIMNAYSSEYPPATAVDPSYKEFFERFYATSDSPAAHEDYVKYFTNDATLIMASKVAMGRNGSLGIAFT